MNGVSMSNVKVKICGITNLEDAMAAVTAGCDAIGFVFYKKSPRYISPEKAKSIISNVPANILTIGVFVEAKEDTVKRIAKFCNLDMLQFHGDQKPSFCDKFKNYRIIKVFRVKNKIDPKEVSEYNVFACLFDTFDVARLGGTGKKFNWKLVRGLDCAKRTIFLSGGLNEKNVSKAIRALKPDWVDASSSVEAKPGKKDHKKLKKFIQKVKRGR